MSAPSKPTRPRKPASKATPARGRPTLYRAAYVEQARRLAMLGQTDKEMAEFFGVNEATLHRWKHAHKDFCESLKSGKELADSRVAESLYKAALGESVVIDEREQTNADSSVIRTKEIKQVPPSTTAMIFWLKNRQPDKWRDRIEHQADLNVTGPSREVLEHLFADRMRQASERRAAMLLERGLSPVS
ncbi:MAG: hypothetical protein LBI59_02545 [Candidatus Accumulibacter sp.]|jgi:hypothetical protein|nr:hypothetical protein [Accumulibacter sp.]